MKIIVKDSHDDIFEAAYEIMSDVINSKDSVTLGLATGSTPEGLYSLFRERKPNVSHVSTVNLDEYVGLSADHNQSYHYFMQKELFSHLNFKANHLPKGDASDLHKACEDYEAILKANPVDIQLLGIGVNAHIAFNEPGTSFDSTTSVVDLTESTITANSRLFDDINDVPKTAITMGLKSIMAAKKILLIALGENKADAIRDAIEKNPSVDCPASILQQHDDVIMLLDKGAASKLSAETLAKIKN